MNCNCNTSTTGAHQSNCISSGVAKFIIDGTQLVLVQNGVRSAPVDLLDAIQAGESKTRLRVDLNSRKLVYTNEDAVNDPTQEDLVSIDTFLGSAKLSTLADVSNEAPSDGDLLSYNASTGKYEPYTIPAGAIAVPAGLDDRGKLVKSNANNNSSSASQNTGVPIGGILEWPGEASTIPAGFLRAEGQELNRSQYAALFAVIGTIYGAGNGSTTFNIPNLNGVVSVPRDGGTFNTLGVRLGEQQHQLSFSEMPQHSHPVNDPGHSHGVNPRFLQDVGSGGNIKNPGAGSVFRGLGSVVINASGTGISIGPQGDNVPHNNIQPSIVIDKIIRVA